MEAKYGKRGLVDAQHPHGQTEAGISVLAEWEDVALNAAEFRDIVKPAYTPDRPPQSGDDCCPDAGLWCEHRPCSECDTYI